MIKVLGYAIVKSHLIYLFVNTYLNVLDVYVYECLTNLNVQVYSVHLILSV